MKKIFSFVILFLLPLFQGEISAQSKFHIGLNGGYVLRGPNQEILYIEKNAWTIGVDVSYSILRDIKINLLTGYFNIPNYQTGYYGTRPDPLYDIAPPKGAYNFSTLEKTSAKIYQTALGITFASHYNSEFYPFVSVYSGFYFFNYLNYSYPSYWIEGDYVVLPSPYVKSIAVTKAFLSIGIGFQIPVADKFSLNLQGLYSLTFASSSDPRSQNFIPVLIGVEYSL